MCFIFSNLKGDTMKKLLSFINIRDLATSVFSSLIIVSLIACGSAAGILVPRGFNWRQKVT
jgi:hypothetical protein